MLSYLAIAHTVFLWTTQSIGPFWSQLGLCVAYFVTTIIDTANMAIYCWISSTATVQWRRCNGHPLRRSSTAMVIHCDNHPLRRYNGHLLQRCNDHPLRRSSIATVICCDGHLLRRSSAATVQCIATAIPCNGIMVINCNGQRSSTATCNGNPL